jgi:hypothetical protein
MKLSQLAARPQLVRIELDSPEIKESYGDTLEFWVWDRQNLETFVKLATLDVEKFDKLAETINDMILDETGAKVVKDDLTLPTDVMMAAISKVVEVLGKPQRLTSATTPQN